MRVSVIGINGLLSASIAKYCNKNAIQLDMYGRTEPRNHTYTNFEQVDLVNETLNYDELQKADVIFYTAGAGIQSKLKEGADLVFHLNVTVPVQIANNLKALNYSGIFVSFGSYFEIGETSANNGFTELDVLQSQLKAPNNYTISKRMLSRFFSSFNASFTFLHFTLPTIYGEHEQAERLIPYTLKSIEKNEPLSFTSGQQVRQYIYIEDVVKILFNAIELKLESGIYNIAGVEELTVQQLVTMLFELKGKSMPEGIFGKIERADIGMKVLKLDGSLLTSKLRYVPLVKLADVYNRYSF